MTIAYYIASPTWGGGEQYVFNLAQQLTQHQLAKCIFLFPAHTAPDMIERFRQLGECPTFAYSDKIWRFSPWAGYQLSQLLNRYEVDILHLNSRQSYGLAAWAKYFSHHSLRVIATQHLVRQAKNTALWCLIYRQIDTLICVSQCVNEVYLKPWKNVKQSPFRQVEVVMNSVPITGHTTPNDQNTDCPIILYRGRICQEKGVIPLLQRLAAVKDLPFRVWIAGTVEPRFQNTWDKALATSPIRDRILMLGFRSDIANLIHQCHIGIAPSLVAESGGPLTLLENMALGLPSIVSNNGAQPEYILSQYNGILCPPDDDAAWISALSTLITNVTLRLRLGQQAAADFATKYNFYRYTQNMLSIYSIA